jgi:hypothetical protein
MEDQTSSNFFTVICLQPFLKELKKLSCKHPSLPSDISTVLPVFHLFVIQQKQRSHPFFPCIFKGEGAQPEIFLMKRLACRTMKPGNNTGLRLVVALFREEMRLELVEIYQKSDKDIEDKERIRHAYGIMIH